jgi:aspartyl-tRNA(Asn)/glutamyl-tRNA(Gln) amidotransferase subunit C
MLMSQRLTRDEVAHVARLARLRLSEAELDEFTEQLADVLEHAEDIERLDVDDVEPTAHPLPLRNVFRPDVVTPSIDRAEVLAAAPATEDGQFRVPQILGEEQ